MHEGDGGPNAGRTGSNDDGVVFLRGIEGDDFLNDFRGLVGHHHDRPPANKNLRDSINAEQPLFSEE